MMNYFAASHSSAAVKVVTRSRTLSTTAELLSTPSRVAHSLEWNRRTGSILNMRIAKDRIDLAVATHPSFQEPFLEVSSISLNSTSRSSCRTSINTTVSQLITKTISKHNVCGIVIDWPLQKEGWCGEACGRVLFVLDQLTANQENTFASSTGASIPLCLYDPHHSTMNEDAWGRNPVYARTCKSTKELHRATQEQYGSATSPSDDDGRSVSVWNAFCEQYLPDSLCRYNKNQFAFYQATVRNSKRTLFPQRSSSNVTGANDSLAVNNTIGNERKSNPTSQVQDVDYF